MLSFACISPHAPILLPDVGTSADQLKVKSTIESLEKLGKSLSKVNPDTIIITSPHPDWGFEVPLHFLMPNDKFLMSNQSPIPNDQSLLETLNKFFRNSDLEIRNCVVFPILTSLDSPQQHYLWGQKIASIISGKRRVAWIASGDMSHRLKENGPYGLHPSGPEFDRRFIELLKAKDVAGILHIDERLVEEAGECGLRSFCMLLGALEETHSTCSGQGWNSEIISYEGPFGVGYLVADFKLETK